MSTSPFETNYSSAVGQAQSGVSNSAIPGNNIIAYPNGNQVSSATANRPPVPPSDQFEYIEPEYVTRDFTGRRGQKTTITDVPVRKRVLLVCVYNKKGTLITHDVIYRLFMKYGEIQKILIFEKCKNWKIFVEMETLDQADKAREALNNYQLYDDGSKMTVYYAKVDQIVFQNNNSGGVDYRELKRRKRITDFPPSFNPQWNQPIGAEELSQNGLGCIDKTKQTLSGNKGQTYAESINIDSAENYNNAKESSNKTTCFPLNSLNNEGGDNNNRDDNNSSSVGKQNNNTTLLPHFEEEDSNNDISKFLIEVKSKGAISHNSNYEKHRNYSFDYSELIRNFESVPNVNSKPSPHRKEPSAEILSDQAQAVQEFSASEDAPLLAENGEALQVDNLRGNQLPPQKKDQDEKVDDETTQEAENADQKINQNENDQGVHQQPKEESNDKESALINSEAGDLIDLNGIYEKLNLLDDDLRNSDEYEGEKEHNFLQGQEANKNWEGGQIDPSQYVNPLYILENKKSRVIYVRGLEKRTLTTRKIYNLFSNFGNIELILFFTDKRYCLIQFETQEDATTAKEQLDSLKVEQNAMRIFYSNYENIKENQEGEKQCEIFKGDKSSFRFRNGKQISVNPVTSTLHVSNLKADTCKADVIIEKFSPFGVIEAFHPINASNKYMCHIKFSSTEEATNALVNLHEEEILGRKIHISFTRTRISPMTTPDSQTSTGSSGSNSSNYRNQPPAYSGFRNQGKMQKQNYSQQMNSKSSAYHRADSFQEITHAVSSIFSYEEQNRDNNDSDNFQQDHLLTSSQNCTPQFQQQIWGGYQGHPQQYSAQQQQQQFIQPPQYPPNQYYPSQHPNFQKSRNGQSFSQSQQHHQYGTYPPQLSGYPPHTQNYCLPQQLQNQQQSQLDSHNNYLQNQQQIFQQQTQFFQFYQSEHNQQQQPRQYNLF